MADGDEPGRTLAFAEIALGQIRALHLTAEPRNYEVWYHYATGYHPSLNRAINATLQSKGTLTADDIQEIYATYLSPARLTDQLDTVGAKVADEIEQVMAMIDATLGSAASYSESLADATHQLGSHNDREGLRMIVESLIKASKDVERDNQALAGRLKASKQEISELQQNLAAVRSESLTDPLTSLANRKYFDQALAGTMAEAASRGRPMALLMADIDRFKSFNDAFGHLTGDQVLRLVALSLKRHVKSQDLAARYGGEEFAVILPDIALRPALALADQIRSSVMAKELKKRSTGESLGRITISIGVAAWHSGDTVQTLIERADACLYAAKRAGRNKVICETDPDVAMPAKTKVA
jgi:diguanylate cyclase